MKQISRKLRSKTGASMLIAILFMMFCLFVGGSVLAAATANGYRVAHMADQQDFLDQRSAGALISDELDANIAANKRLKLEVVDLSEIYTPMKSVNGGHDIDNSRPMKTERTITFKVDTGSAAELTVMQRLLFETAICRYLVENNVTPGIHGNTKTTVELEGFGSVTNLNQFWYSYDSADTQIRGGLDIKGFLGNSGSGGAEFTESTADFLCGGDEDDLYDFMVIFENAQMYVFCDASRSSRERNISGDIREYTLSDNTTGLYDYESITLKTEIQWKDAEIQKGGPAE